MEGFERVWRWVGLAICVALAAWLRIELMTDWLSYDESVNYMIGKSSSWGDFLFQYRSRAHPPLSYLLTMPFLALGSSAFLARAAALLSGLAGVVLIYLVVGEALRVDSRKAGAKAPAALLGALLLSSTPIFVSQSIEVRGYSLCLVFVWSSFWIYFRMRARGFERYSDHVALAAVQLLAVFTEFGAAFHLVGLAALLYAPLFLRWIRRNRWRRVLVFSIPQAVVGCLALANFRWQMGSAGAEFGHTRHALYQGSLGDPGGILAFLLERLPAHMSGILPAGWGLGAFFLLLLAFTPLVGRSSLAEKARALAGYSLVSLSLLFAAALLRKFPFGGVPRHGVAIVPGIVLAGFLTLVAIARHRFRASAARALAATAAAAAVAPAFLLGLQAARPDGRTREELAARIGVAEFAAAPGPVVTNAEGRALLSWWFLPGSAPRRMYQKITRFVVFDYEGISVVRPTSLEEIANTALFYVEHADLCWILLAYHKREREADEAHAFLERALAGKISASLRLSRRADWILDTIVMKVEGRRVAAATSPPR